MIANSIYNERGRKNRYSSGLIVGGRWAYQHVAACVKSTKSNCFIVNKIAWDIKNRKHLFFSHDNSNNAYLANGTHAI